MKISPSAVLRLGALVPEKWVRLAGLLALAFAVNCAVFYTFPVISYFQHRESKKRPEASAARQITLQQVNLNEEKKEKRKLKVREAKPQKAAAKAETGRFNLKLGVASEGGVSVTETDTKAIVYNEGEVDQEAVATKRMLPRKPQAADAAGVSGEVEVEFVVDETGKVVSAKAVKVNPEGYGFKEAAVNAVWEWRFKPATYKKIPVRVRYIVPIRFQ